MRLRMTFVALLVVLATFSVEAVSYIAFEAITVAGTAIGFTTTKILPDGAGGRNATTALCRLETAEIRYTVDGTTPTSTVGTLLEIGDYLQVNGYDSLSRFLSIRTGGTSGKLDCTYSAP